MNLVNYYWYFKSALTPKFCDDVIAYANQQKEVMALTGGFNKDKKLNKQEILDLKRKRNSDLDNPYFIISSQTLCGTADLKYQ